jgi:hypothetical protein
MSTIPDSHDDSNCRRGSPQLDDFPEHLKGDLYYEKPPTAVGDGFEDIPLPDDPCPISGNAGRTQDTEPSTQNAEHTVLPPKQCAPESLRPRPYISVSKRTEPGPSEFLKAVLEAARQKPLPAVAARYYLSGVKLLVALCCELQTAAGGETFFLSCRDAAALVAPTAPAGSERGLPPAPPTDPYVPNSGIRLVRSGVGYAAVDGVDHARHRQWETRQQSHKV